ncbi:hypothetical protein WJX81_008559 [Elliptochloris bilobata]|uniref:Uncharacterized protein n=1 Tax=Elliptochloris bilobata TaxID=381761 RepID=A0AAW1REZ2_9CHLO
MATLLYASRSAPGGHREEVQGKDKLAETKKSEQARREAHKLELQAQKLKKHEEESAAKAVHKLERSFEPVSKRAAKETREAKRREARKESGDMCEHGIWKCRICFPPNNKK